MKNNIWLDGLRSVARVGETAVIAARAGIKYATEKPSNAKLMRETFESLGSTYIKLGQFIASTPSLFPRGSKSEPPFAPPIGSVVKLFLNVCSNPKNFIIDKFTDGWKRNPPLYGPIAPLNCTRYPLFTCV